MTYESVSNSCWKRKTFTVLGTRNEAIVHEAQAQLRKFLMDAATEDRIARVVVTVQFLEATSCAM